MHEVYAYGVIAPSTLIELEASFPEPAGYAEIAGVHASIGGEAAGGAYVLARLGIATKLSGTRLNDDPESRRVMEMLSEAGVDCSSVATDAGTAPTEVVVSAERERTIFGTYGRMLVDRAWSQPSHDDIVSSRIVCLDPFFGADSDQAARWCLHAEVPYVTIDAAVDSNVARHATVLIVSEDFTSRTIDVTDPRSVLVAYTQQCDGLVILTRGSEPLLWGRRGDDPREFTPFSVEARDTTGAGDSFRAGIIYGLLRGYDDTRLLEVASAIAAMVCRTVPGVINSPTVQELESFLQSGR